ncbi:N-acetylglucosamine-6-phosphate deacetylase [Rhodoferax aquaticus]|uniref:N-acetylglucosamine-6-phosphate deacetylase n=1 Tax=Rhodoferax aquaticus TaxID=2527691 RepID=A0A515EJL6_9BURK|nr:N-acetylglucosamine-6-phosphate deacetylase [Rhodoferax aquaticus]QDL52852.1 N-acetylglucosamine-6-phosphate deacetylase [Rhodoferax aquaticus]
MHSLSGNILTPGGFVAGTLQLNAQGRIAAIQGQAISEAQARDSGDALVLPGFIDLHVHGGAGHDIMEGGQAVDFVTDIHARHGTTSLLATTMTAPLSDLDAAFAALSGVCSQRAPGRARVLGVHLEGPFISETRLGAQPPYARPVSVDEIARLNAVAPIRLITLAPEVDSNMDMIAALCAAGYRVQLGHTSGTYEDGVKALGHGATGFTHLFNAMSPMHHREPGMVGAALAHAPYAEIIPDLLHVHPGAIKAAMRAIPGLYCVTDSTSAAGMPDGEYALGRHKVFKCMGGVRLEDGTLAGSTLSMDQALRNLVNTLGLSVQDASRRVSTYAADHLRLADRGRLVVGAWADVVVLNDALQLQQVLVEGEALALNP